MSATPPGDRSAAAQGGSPFCDPLTHEPLVQGHDATSGEVVLRSPSGRVFRVRDGIPIFIDASGISESHRWQQRFYDRLAPWYDLGSALHVLISREARVWREEYLEELTVRPGSRVLEVSVGTGANLERLPPAECFGLDLSWRMLRRCRRKQQRGLTVTLCQGLAEQLPFHANAFDVVFHVGAINGFAAKARALAEMARVARPGAQIMVVDATEKFAERYGNTPVLRALYRGPRAVHRAPVALLPEGVQDVRVKEIAGGELYCLTFNKRDARHD